MSKTLALAVCGLAIILLGTLYARSRAQIQVQAERIAQLESRLSHQTDDLLTQKRETRVLTAETGKLSAKVYTVKKRLQEARSALPSAAGTPAFEAPLAVAPATKTTNAAAVSDSGKPLGKVLQDPAIQKMFRSQQVNVMRQMYGDLVRQWNLSPEEARTFYDLLLDRQTTVVSTGEDSDSSATIVRATSNVADAEAALKASLGDESYAQFQAYTKTLNDRMTLSQFRQQLDAEGVPPLTPDQTQFLLSAMTDARGGQPAGSDLANVFAKGREMKPGGLEEFIKAQTDVNQQVANRAAGVLTPAQLGALKLFQSETLDAQRLGMEMAAKMAPASASPAP